MGDFSFESFQSGVCVHCGEGVEGMAEILEWERKGVEIANLLPLPIRIKLAPRSLRRKLPHKAQKPTPAL